MTAPALDITNPAAAATIGVDLEQQTTSVLARGIVAIATVDELSQAVIERVFVADLRRRVVDYFEPIKSMAFKLHRALCDRENAILKPLDLRDRAIRDAMATFKREQDRVRQEAEAAEAARRRQALEAIAAQEAAQLEAAGAPELAAAVVDQAIAAPPPTVVLPDLVTETGAKFRKTWRWQIVNADRVPREFLTLDEKKIGAYVRAMKSSGAIPGIEIYSVDEPVR